MVFDSSFKLLICYLNLVPWTAWLLLWRCISSQTLEIKGALPFFVVADALLDVVDLHVEDGVEGLLLDVEDANLLAVVLDFVEEGLDVFLKVKRAYLHILELASEGEGVVGGRGFVGGGGLEGGPGGEEGRTGGCGGP